MARELLAIGVDNYEDPRYARLREAPADAWKFWKFFTEELPPDSRFPVASAKLMLNPSAAEVGEYLNDALKRLDNDSVFVFYFAGHGTRKDDWSLLCRDAKDSNVNEKTELEWRLKAHIAAGSLSTAFLEDFSERVRGNAFFCFDICRSAAVLGTRDFGATIPFLFSTTAQASPFYSGEGLRWSLGSCGLGEHSKDDGAFVDALLAEMRATIESGRELRLDDNLATGVARRLGGRQRPSACGSSFVLAPSAFEEFSDGSIFPLIRKRTDDLAQRLVEANVGEGLELSELRREYAALGKRLTEIRAQRVANPPSAVVDVWDAKTILDRFVLIPAGTFQMGNALSPDKIFRRWGGNKALHAAAPRHAVTLTRDYYVCRYPVRRGDFAKFVEATGYRTTAEIAGNARGFGRDGQWSDVVGLSWRNPGFSQTDDHPVVCVSWRDAIKYIEWLNAEHQDVLPTGFQYALPTEAEWEYACRAGSSTEFFWGTNDPKDGQGYLNAADESGAPNGNSWDDLFPFRSGYKATSPVFSFKPNKWGLYDMLGNVWEWCADGYAPYPKSPVIDPIGNLTGSSRIIRGGSWCYGPVSCRSAARSWCDQSSRMSRIGFRLVLKSRVERPAPPRSQSATSNSTSGAGKGSAAVERRNHSNAVTSDARKAGASLSWSYHGVKSVFRYCPAGTFLMGSPKSELKRSADETQHKVTLTKGYWILETPVTQELWKAVTGERRSVYKGDQYPVEDVTWDACADFVSKLNQSVAAPKGFIFALPTEAQWEYACRAGTTTPYNVGASIEKNNANFLISGIKETTPVRSYAPNAWGVYDMHGNVREWCADWYEYFQPTPKTDPLGPSSGGIRVIRGGGWASSAIGIRSAFRDALLPSSSSSTLGFRIVLRPLMKGERAPAVVDVAPTSQAKATKDSPASRPNGSLTGESLELTLYGVKSVFRHIPAGSFTMGSPATESGRYDNETRHSVTLTHDFWLMETPVTQALWRAGAGYYPCVFRGDAFPVEKVSWEDCAEFITQLNKNGAAPKGWIFDLPSEAEWEYACRAGSSTPYDSGYNLTDKDANFNRNVGQTTPVKRYQPNAWGLYDMRGLVWELCADWYGEYATTPATDPIGAENALDRVLRGGSWRDSASACRAAFRACLSPNARHEGVGFRLALRSADLPQRATPTPKPEPIQAPAPAPAKPETLDFDFLTDTFPVAPSDKETAIASAADLDFLTIDLADSSDEKTLPGSMSDDDFLNVVLADSSVEEKLPDAYSVSEIDYAIGSDISQAPEIDVLTSDLTPNPTDVKAESAEASTPPEDASSQARQAGDPLVLTLNGVKSVFRYCPAGTFLMGSPKSEDGRNNNETQHEVTLTKEFWILETPVTQGLWEAIIGEKPSVDKGEKYPVEGVNWHACVDFVSKLNQSGLAPEGFKFALPTEAQWEYACRAGTTSRYNIGDKIRRKDANFGESGINESTPVRRYEPNAWGVYDMHGNIGEWCSDWYRKFKSAPETDPLGATSGKTRVVRGGDWGSAAIGCRSAYRGTYDPSFRTSSLGFRIVLRPLDEGEPVADVATNAQAEASNEAPAPKPHAPRVGKPVKLTLNGVKSVFRYCPAGTFLMGSPKSEDGRYNNETQHKVTLTKKFWILETPVTQGLWKAVTGKNRAAAKGDQYPVENVSWNDCVDFVSKLNRGGYAPEGFKFALPTEAQWEYACRAKTKSPYNFGNSIGKNNANFRESGINQTTPVKSYKPNAWGIYDMHGNVREWCSDWYGNFQSTHETDPLGSKSGWLRVIRGGGWGSSASGCRSAYRGTYDPSFRTSSLGFRIVLRPLDEGEPVADVVDVAPVVQEEATPASPEVVEREASASAPAEVSEVSPASPEVVEREAVASDEAPVTEPSAPEEVSDVSPASPEVVERKAEASDEAPANEPQGPQAGDPLELTLNGVKCVFRLCPAGTFLMGSPLSEGGRYLDETQHKVTLSKNFWILETQVTQGLWEAVSGKKQNQTKGVSHPVENVSWDDCANFVSELNQGGYAPEGFKFSLPTEAQWEYACRAGTTTPYNFGDSIKKKDANFGNSGIKQTTPVKKYKPNAWGVYDMHGNVHEWCADWYGEYQSSPETDPLGAASGWLRVVRGGGWGSYARGCRSAYRGTYRPYFRTSSLGFRIVLRPLEEGELVTDIVDVAPISQEEAKPASPAEVSEVSTVAPEVVERKAEASDEAPANEPQGPQAGDPLELTLNGVKCVFRLCPAGTFLMGSPETEDGRHFNETQHEVTLTKNYWILETPVTQGFWGAVSGKKQTKSKRVNHPVENVSWNACVDFVSKLNRSGYAPDGLKFALPTEAQWEYACRAGTTTPYNFGNSIKKKDANFGNSGINQTTPVRSYAPNAWGVYDMHGNVSELCSDWYERFQPTPETDPLGPTSGVERVVRGGCWGSYARWCRSAYRSSCVPSFRSSSLGFRIVLRPLEEGEPVADVGDVAPVVQEEAKPASPAIETKERNDNVQESPDQVENTLSTSNSTAARDAAPQKVEKRAQASQEEATSEDGLYSDERGNDYDEYYYDDKEINYYDHDYEDEDLGYYYYEVLGDSYVIKKIYNATNKDEDEDDDRDEDDDEDDDLDWDDDEDDDLDWDDDENDDENDDLDEYDDADDDLDEYDDEDDDEDDDFDEYDDEDDWDDDEGDDDY